MKSLQELASATRQINAANGWGLTFELDHIPNSIALIHSEITEAYQESKSPKIARELGDVIIRCLDLGELIEPGFFREFNPEHLAFLGVHPPRVDQWAQTLMQLHQLTSETLEVFRKVEDPRAMQVAVLSGLATVSAYAWQLMQLDYPDKHPAEVIDSILQANRQRGYRHGGRRT